MCLRVGLIFFNINKLLINIIGVRKQYVKFLNKNTEHGLIYEYLKEHAGSFC